MKDELTGLISSVVGFHNPKKHSGLTPEAFLLTYLKRQAKRCASGSRVDDRIMWILAVLTQWDKWCIKVKEYFPNTLMLK